MKLVINGTHDLDVATLRARVDARVADYAARYPKYDIASYYRWADDRVARAEYRGGSAVITLGERDVSVALELPFFARLYRARIEDFVQREMASIVARTDAASGTA